MFHRILIRCENGHDQIIRAEGPREYVENLAKLMDGTHPMYRFPPRQYPTSGSSIGRCGMPDCGAWISCSVSAEPPE
jgi:hypothetical protein